MDEIGTITKDDLVVQSHGVGHSIAYQYSRLLETANGPSLYEFLATRVELVNYIQPKLHKLHNDLRRTILQMEEIDKVMQAVRPSESIANESTDGGVFCRLFRAGIKYFFPNEVDDDFHRLWGPYVSGYVSNPLKARLVHLTSGLGYAWKAWGDIKQHFQVLSGQIMVISRALAYADKRRPDLQGLQGRLDWFERFNQTLEEHVRRQRDFTLSS